MEEGHCVDDSQKERGRGVLRTYIGDETDISPARIWKNCLANRLGDIILKNPAIVTPAQRAFLKDVVQPRNV